MPLFNQSSHLQITGGNFYDVAGDINVQNNITRHDNHLQLRYEPESYETALPWQRNGVVGPLDRIGRGASPHEGIDRPGSARHLPYDISSRPQIHSQLSHHEDVSASSSGWDTAGSTMFASYSPPSSEWEPPGHAVDFTGDMSVPNNASTQDNRLQPRSEPESRLPWLANGVVGPLDRRGRGASRHGGIGHQGTGRHRPYDISSRPQIHTQSSRRGDAATSSSGRDTAGSSTSAFHSPSPNEPEHSYCADSHQFNGDETRNSPHETHVRDQRIRSPIPHILSLSSWNAPRQYVPATTINGGTFVGGNINHIERRGEAGLHILYRAVAGGASHDSGERFPPPRCHPETRTEMLQELQEWSSQTDTSSCVLWLHGPAGAGKSAIAQTLSQQLEADKRLGASFFFKRGDSTRGNARGLFPTISYQLATRLPEFKDAVSQEVEKDFSVVNKSLSIQLQNLVIEPFKITTYCSSPFIVIIDGLDECNGQKIQQELLWSLGNSLHKHSPPIRILISSRPEFGRFSRVPVFLDCTA
ncbi:hypothetical protein B0H10DRAFT_643900 [Mycena sp. CBHHK59/15]|nr:hypothetical protein B0H10DRAFT_643900 [Mycena sp. CBHHK59/15]